MWKNIGPEFQYIAANPHFLHWTVHFSYKLLFFYYFFLAFLLKNHLIKKSNLFLHWWKEIPALFQKHEKYSGGKTLCN